MTTALKWSVSRGGRRWSGSEVSQSKYLYFSSLMKFYIVHSSQGLLLLLRGRSLPCRWWADRQALVHWQWDSGNDDQTVTVLSLYCHCHHQVILSCAAGPAGPSIQVTVENCQTSGNQTGAPATTAAPAPSLEELVRKIGAKIDHVQTQVELIINIIHYININDTMIIIKGDWERS